MMLLIILECTMELVSFWRHQYTSPKTHDLLYEKYEIILNQILSMINFSVKWGY